MRKSTMKTFGFVMFVAAAGLAVMFLTGCDDNPTATSHADHGHSAGDCCPGHGDSHAPAVQASQAVQETCPVMGAAINENISTEYQGKTVYFCCPPCEATFNADPEQYLDKLPQFQE